MGYTYILIGLCLGCNVFRVTRTGTCTLETFTSTNNVMYRNSIPNAARCCLSITDDSSGEEYCPFERFRAQCSDNEIIMIKHARYGRMRIGKCIDKEGTISCYIDSIFNVKCLSHKTHCRFLNFRKFSIAKLLRGAKTNFGTYNVCSPIWT